MITASPIPRQIPVCVGIAAVALLAAAPLSAATARGVVFADRNGDGRRDPGEPGLKDVLVSNQRQIVKTELGGRWELPATDSAIDLPQGYEVRMMFVDERRDSFEIQPAVHAFAVMNVIRHNGNRGPHGVSDSPGTTEADDTPGREKQPSRDHPRVTCCRENKKERSS